MIEKPRIAFGTVREITDYFVDVLVNDNKPEEYLAKQQLYQKSFQEHFDKYDLETDQIENFIPASQKLQLENKKFNVGGSSRKINRLHVNQKIEEKQFICFHNINEPVVVDKIVIWDGGYLRCVLQNTYYDGTDSGFFSLLQTAKQLKIHNDQDKDNQVLVDLADYIEGKYVLNTNWKREELDQDMRIKIYDYRYDQFLSAAQRLRKYFKNVSIDRIWTTLETENVIDQECEVKYIFQDCRDANPQKLVVNAKLAGNDDLILFLNADGEVCISEITIGERGSFDATVHNQWRNYKNGSERKDGFYSLISCVETLIIQNNPWAVCDLDRYVSRNYKTKSDKWKVQKPSKNIVVRINGVKGLDEQINRLKDYFGYIFVDDRKSIRDGRQQMLTHINVKSNDIRQRQMQNKHKQQSIDNSVASIQDARRRIERAEARLGRRYARFQEYLALTE